MKYAFSVLVCVASMIFVSCVSREHAVARWGIQAELVDASNGLPIANREVLVIVDDEKLKGCTNRRGRVRSEPISRAYWTWLGGPAFGSRNSARIEIMVEEYQPYSIIWERFSESTVTVDPPCLDLGEVKIRNR